MVMLMILRKRQACLWLANGNTDGQTIDHSAWLWIGCCRISTGSPPPLPPPDGGSVVGFVLC